MEVFFISHDISWKRGKTSLDKIDDVQLNHILTALKELEYGSVVITVHDGKITQIDTTEKKRFSLTKNRS